MKPLRQPGGTWLFTLGALLLAGFCSVCLATQGDIQDKGDIYDAAGLFVEASILNAVPAHPQRPAPR